MNGNAYRFYSEDVESVYEEFDVPQENRLNFTDQDIKCPGCNWTTQALYVLALNLDEAKRLLAERGAGLCAECYVDMLVDLTEQ